MRIFEKLKELGLDNDLANDRDLVENMAMFIYTLNKISEDKDSLGEEDMLRLMKRYRDMLETWIQVLEERKK